MTWALPRSKKIEYHTYSGRKWFGIQGNHLKPKVRSTQSRRRKQLMMCKHTGYWWGCPFYVLMGPVGIEASHLQTMASKGGRGSTVYLWLYSVLCIGQSTQSLYICFSGSGDNHSVKEMLGTLRLEVAQRCYSICQLISAALVSWMTLISKWCIAQFCPEHEWLKWMAMLFLKFISPNSEAIVCYCGILYCHLITKL